VEILAAAFVVAIKEERIVGNIKHWVADVRAKVACSAMGEYHLTISAQ